MQITFFADVVCPWCYIGHVRLMRAIARYPQGRISVEYAPFQLAPNVEGNITLDAYYVSRGLDPAVMKKAQANATEVGRSLELTIDYSRIHSMFNTVDAHRLVKLAPAEKRTALLDLLHQGYFAEGRNYGAIDELAGVGERAGMGPAAGIAAALRTPEHRQAVRDEGNHAYTLPIITVPYMVVDGKWPVQFLQIEGVADFALSNLYPG